MSEKKGLLERIKDVGQTGLVLVGLSGALGAGAVRAWGWASSGPIALTKAQKLEKDVRRLKRQSRFMIRAAEKTLREPYDWKNEEREVARTEGDE